MSCGSDLMEKSVRSRCLIGNVKSAYKRECQEKNLPQRLNTVPFLSRHSAPLIERALLTESGLPQGPSSLFRLRVRSGDTLPSPVGFFPCRDGVHRFLKQQA